MKKSVKDIRAEINQIENYFFSRKEQLDKINKLGTKIKEGLSTNFTQYDKIIKEFNDDLPKFNQYKEKYENLAIEYDEIVKKYNKLAKEAYRRWWLIPIPLPGKHTSI